MVLVCLASAVYLQFITALSMRGDHQSAAYVAQYAAAGIDLSSHLEALQVDRMLFTSVE